MYGMTVTSNDVANQAIQDIGNNMPQVNGQAPTFDNSPAGVALQRFYAPTVATVGRQFGWDFARNTATLSLSGNPAPAGWLYEYLYPSNGIEVWQLMPTPPFADANNPLPVNWNVGNTLVASVQTKVIWSNLANAQVTYNNNPSESTWDPLFREAVVRLLASVLGMAIAGRPDSAAAYLESGAAFENIGEGRPD
jgi:hypothetical protein